MANGNDDMEVKDVSVEHVEPVGDDNDDSEKTEETEPESSREETDDEEESEPSPKVEPKPKPAKSAGDDIANIKDETPRERALRLEVTRLRRLGRKEQSDELLGGHVPIHEKPEISPERKKVLEKYKPEEIDALRETIDVLAEEMGFVRKDVLNQTTYANHANDELNTFLEKHAEYLPENDTDGTLWNAFKDEYALYKQPSDPREFKKIFDRVHKSVFGIKPAADINKVNAQNEKIKVASHKSASPAPTSRKSTPRNSSGLRLDMLKGFEQEEIDEMTGED
jgi:hypothetical protein